MFVPRLTGRLTCTNTTRMHTWTTRHWHTSAPARVAVAATHSGTSFIPPPAAAAASASSIAAAAGAAAPVTPAASSSPSLPSPSAAAWSASHAAHYQPLSVAQRALLFAGSSVLSLLDPHRGDLVAAVGELTGPLTDLPLRALQKRMEASDEGRWIMQHKPRLDSQALPLQHMRDTMPAGSLGGQYARFMLDRGYSPDERAHVKSVALYTHRLPEPINLSRVHSPAPTIAVSLVAHIARSCSSLGVSPPCVSACVSVCRFVSDPEVAYVLQRYREIHDMLHVLTGMPTNVMGELGQKVRL